MPSDSLFPKAVAVGFTFCRCVQKVLLVSFHALPLSFVAPCRLLLCQNFPSRLLLSADQPTPVASLRRIPRRARYDDAAALAAPRDDLQRGSRSRAHPSPNAGLGRGGRGGGDGGGAVRGRRRLARADGRAMRTLARQREPERPRTLALSHGTLALQSLARTSVRFSASVRVPSLGPAF
eukprot:4883154-Pleurochrysis_carterae.AAC.3